MNEYDSNFPDKQLSLKHDIVPRVLDTYMGHYFTIVKPGTVSYSVFTCTWSSKYRSCCSYEVLVMCNEAHDWPLIRLLCQLPPVDFPVHKYWTGSLSRYSVRSATKPMQNPKWSFSKYYWKGTRYLKKFHITINQTTLGLFYMSHTHTKECPPLHLYQLIFCFYCLILL